MSTRARKAESEYRDRFLLIIWTVQLIRKTLPLRSPGYGLTLLSQSTTSALHTAETISVPAASRSNPSDHGTAPEQAFQTPEDLALNAARALLEQVSRGGCVDEAYQWLVCLLMILGTEDVARCRMGSLTPLTWVFRACGLRG